MRKAEMDGENRRGVLTFRLEIDDESGLCIHDQ